MLLEEKDDDEKEEEEEDAELGRAIKDKEECKTLHKQGPDGRKFSR